MIAKSHAIIGLASWIVVAPLLYLPPLSSPRLMPVALHKKHYSVWG